MSISSASAQSESSLASRNFFFDDNINATASTPPSKRGHHRTTDGDRLAMTSSGNSLHRSGGTNIGHVSSPAAMNVRADVESDRRLNRVDETQRNISTTTTSRSVAATNSLDGRATHSVGVRAPADIHRTPTAHDGLPTIVVDDINVEDDDGGSECKID